MGYRDGFSADNSTTSGSAGLAAARNRSSSRPLSASRAFPSSAVNARSRTKQTKLVAELLAIGDDLDPLGGPRKGGDRDDVSDTDHPMDIIHLPLTQMVTSTVSMRPCSTGSRIRPSRLAQSFITGDPRGLFVSRRIARPGGTAGEITSCFA